MYYVVDFDEKTKNIADEFLTELSILIKYVKELPTAGKFIPLINVIILAPPVKLKLSPVMRVRFFGVLFEINRPSPSIK